MVLYAVLRRVCSLYGSLTMLPPWRAHRYMRNTLAMSRRYCGSGFSSNCVPRESLAVELAGAHALKEDERLVQALCVAVCCGPRSRQRGVSRSRLHACEAVDHWATAFQSCHKLTLQGKEPV